MQQQNEEAKGPQERLHRSGSYTRDTRMQGYLTKRGRSVRRNWKRRWFVLCVPVAGEDAQLLYYLKSSHAIERGTWLHPDTHPPERRIRTPASAKCAHYSTHPTFAFRESAGRSTVPRRAALC